MAHAPGGDIVHPAARVVAARRRRMGTVCILLSTFSYTFILLCAGALGQAAGYGHGAAGQ